MQTHTDLAALPNTAKNAIVIIGNFDGLHLGHQALTQVAHAWAQEQHLPLSLLTFSPHPQHFFQHDLPQHALLNSTQRDRQLAVLGIQHLLIQDFNSELAALSAHDFVQQILVQQLQVAGVVVGENFRYGHKRSGDILTLQQAAHEFGFGVLVAPSAKTTDGLVYSSSRIRAALQNGNVEAAQELLGQPFEIAANVQHGDGRAKNLGYPTANLDLGNYQRPRYGVYAVQVLIKDQWVPAIANIGVRPTFAGPPREWLEVHIPNFSGDLYGQMLRVLFRRFIRPEQKFDGVEALKQQIAADIIKAGLA